MASDSFCSIFPGHDRPDQDWTFGSDGRRSVHAQFHQSPAIGPHVLVLAAECAVAIVRVPVLTLSTGLPDCGVSRLAVDFQDLESLEGPVHVPELAGKARELIQASADQGVLIGVVSSKDDGIEEGTLIIQVGMDLMDAESVFLAFFLAAKAWSLRSSQSPRRPPSSSPRLDSPAERASHR